MDNQQAQPISFAAAAALQRPDFWSLGSLPTLSTPAPGIRLR
jgi:hypothetical protein